MRRDDEVKTIAVAPRYDAAEEHARIGFRYGAENIDLGAGAAARHALDSTWFVASRTVSIFSRLFEENQRKQISGVVGVSDVANETLDTSTKKTWLLVAVVSLSLGLINLFPFLPLDGGHIFWSLVEKLRGKPVPFAVMERAGVIGFVLVIMLFVVGLTNDIGRISGGGFGGR